MLKKNTRYPGSGLFFRGMMGPVYQTATKDPKTPSAKMIFLDSASGVTKARSGDVSERSVTSLGSSEHIRMTNDSPFSSCVVCTCHGRRLRASAIDSGT